LCPSTKKLSGWRIRRHGEKPQVGVNVDEVANLHLKLAVACSVYESYEVNDALGLGVGSVALRRIFLLIVTPRVAPVVQVAHSLRL
jgi:hypothetical protein